VTNSAANEGRRDYCAAAPWRLRTLRAVLGHVAALRGGTPPRARAAPQLQTVLARSFGVLSAAFSEGLRRHRRRAAATAGAGASGVAGGEGADTGAGCHGVYGVDLMLDEALRVWLIEVQIGPQMDCACPQDEQLKEGLLRALLAHSLPAPRNPLAHGAQAPPGSCASGARLGRAALPANVSLALALQAAAAAAAATEPEDEWQPMLSIPLEAAVDDESCRMRTDEEYV